MRRWLIRWLGGVPKGVHHRLYSAYINLASEFNDTIEKHQMQGAWEQMKAERKARRVH